MHKRPDKHMYICTTCVCTCVYAGCSGVVYVCARVYAGRSGVVYVRAHVCTLAVVVWCVCESTNRS